MIKKWMMLETVNKTAPEAMALPDNLVLICKFEGRNHVICLFTLHDS